MNKFIFHFFYLLLLTICCNVSSSNIDSSKSYIHRKELTNINKLVLKYTFYFDDQKKIIEKIIVIVDNVEIAKFNKIYGRKIKRIPVIPSFANLYYYAKNNEILFGVHVRGLRNVTVVEKDKKDYEVFKLTDYGLKLFDDYKYKFIIDGLLSSKDTLIIE